MYKTYLLGPQAQGFGLWANSSLMAPRALTRGQMAAVAAATITLVALTALNRYREDILAAALSARLTGYIISPILRLVASYNQSVPFQKADAASKSAGGPPTTPPSPSSSDVDEEAIQSGKAQLIAQKEAIESALTQRDEGAKASDDKILTKIPSNLDGNCLFHSLASHLIFQQIKRPDQVAAVASRAPSVEKQIETGALPTHGRIRSVVADYMHDDLAKDTRLQEEAAQTIREFNLAAQERYQEEKEGLQAAAQYAQTPEEKKLAQDLLEKLGAPEQIGPEDFNAYITKLREPTFFGGGAELYVLAKFYDITIRVYVENRLSDADSASSETSAYEFIYEVAPEQAAPQAGHSQEETQATSAAEARLPKPVCHLLFSPQIPHYDFLMPVDRENL